jgi:hypothetical protein
VFSLNYLSLIQQAVKSVTNNSIASLPADSVVEALLQAEKSAKKNKTRYCFDQLIGTWQLCFITGTKKTRQKAGIVLGSGRYLPKWITIQISYSKAEVSLPIESIEAGTVENVIKLGKLKLIVQGPTKFLSPKNILAFDFTRLTIELWGKKLYQGYIRGGKDKEANFYPESVGKQAFFAYFLVNEQAIAARGRGGGLALWGKQSN